MRSSTKLVVRDIIAMLDGGERLPSLEEIEKEFVVDDKLMLLMIEYWLSANALAEAKKSIRRLGKEEK